MNVAASTPVATSALFSWPVRVQLVDDGAAAAPALVVSISTAVVGRHHFRLDHVGDGERVWTGVSLLP